MMKKRIIYVVNVDWFFVSHRLPLAKEALSKGWDVFLVSKDTGRFGELQLLGIKCISIDFDRSGKNPLKELKLIHQLRSIYKKIKPDVIHQITLKPCIYGTIAYKGGAKVVNAVSGLGYSFTDNRKSIGKIILIALLKIAFKSKPTSFIFQNPDDLDFYRSLGFIKAKNYIVIKGSGVDEHNYPFTKPIEKDKVVVTLLARMLKDKGVLEFIQAANILKENLSGLAEFVLVGGMDVDNPAHITKEELQEKCDGFYIKWLGHSNDVRSIYIKSDVVCLPSYREGLPKSLVEAMAIGRPIITADTIGCRECVEDGLNGFLVPVKDSIFLAEKIKKLVLDKELRKEMGLESRIKMVKEMSLKQVVQQTFEFYDS